MSYTTHGLMTPADRADHDRQHDTYRHPGCPGHLEDGVNVICSAADDCPDDQALYLKDQPVGTYERMQTYFRQSPTGRLTARQRRRLVKKAGRDPEYVIMRDDGMGYSPAHQGMKELAMLPVPISGGPY